MLFTVTLNYKLGLNPKKQPLFRKERRLLLPYIATGRLEFICCLDACVVAELEVFRPVQGVTLVDPLRVKGVERFKEEVFRRYVARTDCKAADTVEVTVGHSFSPGPAEEGAVLEVFIVRKSVPAARHVRVGLADIKAHSPEMGRAA